MLECFEHNKYHSKLWLQMYSITKQEKKKWKTGIVPSSFLNKTDKTAATAFLISNVKSSTQR